MRTILVHLLAAALCATAFPSEPTLAEDYYKDLLVPPFDCDHFDTDGAKANTLLDATCKALHRKYPNKTLYAPSAAYNETNTDYWSAAAALGPACIFEPTLAEELSVAMLLLKRTRVPFAVKGGGHMPIAGYNNIGSNGILLSTSSFTGLSATHNHSRLNIGVGNRWGDVYKYLMPFGKLAVGGRITTVGIPGYMLGGGISFLANQYGWAASSVLSYTGVLASGKVFTATAHNEYSDLFWALKGGGNSFAILTNIEVATYNAPLVTVGDSSYGSGDAVKQKWTSAIVNLALHGNADPRHAVIPIATYISSMNPTYAVTRFYNGQNIRPAIFKNFTAPVFTPTTDTFKPQALSTYVQGFAGQLKAVMGFDQRFYGLCIPASVEAVNIAQDTLHSLVDNMLYPKFKGLWVVSLAIMPMPTSFMINDNKKGSNPQGLTPDFGPSVWLEFSHTWKQGIDEAHMTHYLQELDKQIRAKLNKAGHAPKRFIYMNDADSTQDIFAGYPKENIARLKKIRQKYDPAKMLSKQMPGGWKLDP